MIEPIASAQGLTYHVRMTVPPPALELRRGVVNALHASDRHIGVTTRQSERGLGLGILTGADDEGAARSQALRLVTAALAQVGLAELAPDIEVDDVTSQPVLPGGAHPVTAPPPLAYRKAMLADGRILSAARVGPLGEWFAYTDDDPAHVMAGRSLPEVLRELFGLPWGDGEQWFFDAIESLAGYPTDGGIAYPCPCCDYLTLQQPPPGTHTTCEVCAWEDERVQFRDPDRTDGPNSVSLRDARETFRLHGTSDMNRRGISRQPRPHEKAPAL